METKKFYSREDEETAQQVREALSQGYEVDWTSTYETFYGWRWESWVLKQLEGVPCRITGKRWNRDGYTDELVITPTAKEDQP